MQTEGDISDDAAFADVLADLMQDRLSSSEAIGRYAEVCEDNAARLRCDPTAPLQCKLVILKGESCRERLHGHVPLASIGVLHV